jgi:hypothetical protein
MTRDELRRHTVLIIRKNRKYLVGKILYSDELRWSTSQYDAWQTRNTDAARRVADAVGGEIVLFNPIVNQLKFM